MDVNDMDYIGEEIKLDKIRHIKYTIKGLKVLSKAYGSVHSAMAKIEKLNENFDVETLDDICIFVHAGLIHQDDQLKIEDVENILEFGHITSAMQKIMEAIRHSMPNPAEVSNDNQGESSSISIKSNTLPASNGTSRKKK